MPDPNALEPNAPVPPPNAPKPFPLPNALVLLGGALNALVVVGVGVGEVNALGAAAAGGVVGAGAGSGAGAGGRSDKGVMGVDISIPPGEVLSGTLLGTASDPKPEGAPAGLANAPKPPPDELDGAASELLPSAFPAPLNAPKPELPAGLAANDANPPPLPLEGVANDENPPPDDGADGAAGAGVAKAEG